MKIAYFIAIAITFSLFYTLSLQDVSGAIYIAIILFLIRLYNDFKKINKVREVVSFLEFMLISYQTLEEEKQQEELFNNNFKNIIDRFKSNQLLSKFLK